MQTLRIDCDMQCKWFHNGDFARLSVHPSEKISGRFGARNLSRCVGNGEELGANPREKRGMYFCSSK